MVNERGCWAWTKARAFFSSFSLLTSFLPSDIPREVILPLKLRANSIEGTWELSFQHHRHSFQHRLSVCLSNYFSNFFRSSLAVLSFFSFSCNWGEWLHCQVSPPFLEAEVSLVFGETGIVLFKGYIRIYVPLGRFKDLGGFILFEEW